MGTTAWAQISSRFRIEGELGRGGMGFVYDAIDLATGHRVALKTLREPSPRNIYRIKREFRVLADLQHPNLVALSELHVSEGQWFFTMERIDGAPFGAWVTRETEITAAEPAAAQDTMTTADDLPAVEVRADSAPGTFDPPRLIEAVRQLAEALGFLHGVGRVHCDVKPSNTLVTADGRLVLLDFGLTRGWEGEDPADPRTAPEGTVRYMAPEQGSLGDLTPAADMYAVGVMIFEALTGNVPFTGTAMHVLADRRRRVPPRPSTLVADVPPVLDELCIALMAIDPKSRPTAAQVLARLEGPDAQDRRRLDRALGESLPERFVGRGAVMDQLSQLLNEATGPGGSLRAVVIMGEPGVGKTALAREFAQRAADEHGVMVLSSRCNEQEAVPLRAFDGAMDRLSAHLLGHDESLLEAALPDDTSALLALFPVLARVPALARRVSPSTHAVRPEELRRRAVDLLQTLLLLFAEHDPMVLFVDDLQWVDNASLALLGLLASAPRPLPLLLLATARPPAEGEPGPLERLRASAPQWQDRGTAIALGGLDAAEADQLLDVAWAQTIDPARRESVVRDAEGHPFLLRELARFVAALPDVCKGSLPSLAEALGTRIERLPERDLRLLEAIVLTGVPVGLDTVCEATGLALVDCAYAAQRLKGQQLLRVTQRAERKVLEPYHDRVREVLEDQFDAHAADRRAQIHQALGQALLERAPSPRGAAVYAIVENLNRATPPKELEATLQLTALNLEAGQHALAATDYRTAGAYLDTGIGLLPSDAWSAHFTLSFELHLAHMQALYLGGDHQGAAACFEPLATRATLPRDISRVFRTKVNLDMNEFRDLDALATAREGLARLGHPLPRSPSKLQVLRELLWMKFTLRHVKPADYTALPHVEDEAILETQLLQHVTNHAALRADQNTMAIISVRGMRLIKEHGLTPAAASMLGNYLWLRLGILQEYDAAEALRKAALEIYEQYEDDPRVPRAGTLLILNGFCAPWSRPYAECARSMRVAYEHGVEQGDDMLGYVGILLQTLFLQEQGGPIPELVELAEEAHQAIARRKLRNWADAAYLTARVAHARTSPRDGKEYAAHTELAHVEHEDSIAGLTWHLSRCSLAYTLGDHDALEASVQGCARVAHQVMGMFALQLLSLWDAASAQRQLEKASWFERLKLHRRLRSAERKHAAWAARCPENFAHQHRLVAGIGAAARGERETATEHFDASIDLAAAHGCAAIGVIALEQRSRLRSNDTGRRADLREAASLAEQRSDLMTASVLRAEA